MRIAIIGSNHTISTSQQTEFAYALGKDLLDNNFSIINGGMGGIMEASAKGAQASSKFSLDKVIAVLPVDNPNGGNQYSGIKIATHLGTGRNRLIILNSDAVIAIGGGAGTLNEMTLAWELGKPLAGFNGGEGWSSKLAGQSIDSRRTDFVVPIKTTTDAITWLNKLEEKSQ